MSAEERALLVRALKALRAAVSAQSCDGSGTFTGFHFDLEGNEIGSEHCQCAGCCACFVSDANSIISDPLAVALLKEADRG